MEVLRRGYRVHFLLTSSTFSGSDPSSQLLPVITQGCSFERGSCGLTGSWKPVIDLSRLNGFIHQTHFKMETSQSVRRGDWMVSINLKDAYLQFPVHPDSCRFLQFVVDGQVYQFRALCFGFSTAPQVFTRVMAPVSLILHRMGIRLLLYLDHWLLLTSSHHEALQARDAVLSLCC